ncbi:threonine synthase [Candidatus Saccharibacteria bacterium]|nr:threonine synthase [Candidatus Saccharibacteria bacterium]
MSDRLISTRDPERIEYGYSDALLQGLAPDGGLYVPGAYPTVDEESLRAMSGLDYVDLFTRIKSLYVDDIPSETQAQLASAAYSKEKFPVPDGNIVPLTQVDRNFFIQNLSLGPTAAFKDMALQPLGQDMNHALSEREQSLMLLGATSGDTGSAAEAAIKGLGRAGLVMLSPENGMSDFQSAQMSELTGGNILNLSVRGNFDACQALVKAIKSDAEFADLGAVNSINWGRIASQIPYYFSGYLHAVDGLIGRPVDFVVPTGNFGNILAGYIAREMGLPIRRLIVATNENSVLNNLIQDGKYQKTPAQITTSPSMDISEASNYERLLFDIFEGDALKVRDYMQMFKNTGTVRFEDFDLPYYTLREMGFDSGVSHAATRLESIRWVHAKRGIVIDPHTADAVTVASRKADEDVPIVCMSTALPVKFESTIESALGFVPEREDPRFIGIEEREQGGFVVVDDDIDEVKEKIRSFRSDSL